MGRVLLDKYEDGTVGAGATDLWTSPDVPDGQIWHVSKFGGGAIRAALVALQVRTGVSPDVWKTIRAVAAPGSNEYEVNRDFVGDDVIKFRVVRRERSGEDQPIIFWLEGYKVT